MGGKSGGIMGGAASGASMGSAFGPWGAAIGAVAGGAMGAMSNGSDEAVDGANSAAGISSSNLSSQLAYLQGTTADAGRDLRNYYDLQNFTPNLSQTSPYNISGYNALDLVNVALGLPSLKGGSFTFAQKLNEVTKHQDDQKNLAKLYEQAVMSDPSGNHDMNSADHSDKLHTITSVATQLMGKKGLTGGEKDFLSKYQSLGGFGNQTGTSFGNLFKPLTAEQQKFSDDYNNGTVEYQDAGTSAEQSKQLQDLVRNTPGYQFSVDTANRGVEASAAARGMTLSSNNLEALNQTNQQMADSQYTTVVNGIMSMAGMGKDVATNNQGQVKEMQTAQNNALSNLGTNLANTKLSLGQQVVGLMGTDAANRGNAALTSAQAQSTSAQANGQTMSDGLGMLTSALKKPGGMGGAADTGIRNPMTNPFTRSV